MDLVITLGYLAIGVWMGHFLIRNMSSPGFILRTLVYVGFAFFWPAALLALVVAAVLHALGRIGHEQ